MDLKPKGEKMKQALHDFSDSLHLDKIEDAAGRKALVSKIILKYDLSPLEEEFFRRQVQTESPPASV